MFATKRFFIRAVVVKPVVSKTAFQISTLERRMYATTANAPLAEKLSINGDRLWYLLLRHLPR